MNSKLVLGTAQFGLDYGVNNNRGKIPEDEISEILYFASNEGLSMLDTAYGYGDSEECIGKALLGMQKDFQIVSKLPKCKRREVARICQESLERLNIQRFYGYLVHNIDNVYEDLTGIWNEMLELKEKGVVKKIGFSLYFPRELEFLLDKKINFDIIQLPYSIFDQRFNTYFEKLNQKEIEIHVRSIFLQGLIYRNAAELNGKFTKMREKLEALKNISIKNKISMPLLALGFALLNKRIDKVVIGVDSLDNLKENIAEIQKISSVIDVYDEIALLREDNEDIILPINWKN
jgi:aryl-alcohol dehydrogenase-like predicted oxidoreductase